ncbi:hypothetical protein [Aquimarina litoralis]
MNLDKEENLWIALAIDTFCDEASSQKRQFYTVISYEKWYYKE